MLEIGIDPQVTTQARRSVMPRAGHQVLELLYVGRFVPLKGMGLGLSALGDLQRRGVCFALTMIGQGPEFERWQAQSKALGIAEHVTWLPWMRQEHLRKAYRQFDLLLFPSLHDSSGNVVLEALAEGLPVVCLELGGPACIVDPTCGQLIVAADCDEQELIKRLAAVLGAFGEKPERLVQLRAGAQRRAEAFAWPQVIAQVWGPAGLAYRLVADGGATFSGAATETRKKSTRGTAHESL